jgi:hypothetical protein
MLAPTMLAPTMLAATNSLSTSVLIRRNRDFAHSLVMDLLRAAAEDPT